MCHVNVGETLAERTTALLDQCESWIRRYIILSTEQRVVTALWIAHTWVIDASDFTPYLHITAPESGCRKSRLLETLAPLVHRPWKTDGASKAVLVRKIDAEQPTLLLDECDVAFSTGSEYAEALRGVLNAGFRRNGTYSCCESDGKGTISYRDFSCFGPKAIAGIGTLPYTVESRSILIAMRRKLPGERVERLRLRAVEEQSLPIRALLEAWSTEAVAALKDLQPAPIEDLGDRQQDVSDPLLAIAELADGQWPAKARRALLTLFADSAAKQSGASVGVGLLGAIKVLLAERDRVPSAELARELQAMEGEPWADRYFDAYQLASRLRKYNIHPHKIRFRNGVVLNGYVRSDFMEAWRQYCSGTSGTNVTPVTEPALAEVE